MLDFSVRALLAAQQFEEAEALVESSTQGPPEQVRRAKLLLELANGADPVSSYRDFLERRPPAFEDRAVFSYLSRITLERALTGADSISLRCQAAELLGALKDPLALSTFARMLANKDVSPGTLLVRRASAEALALLGGARARDAVEEFLRDEDPAIRRAALLCCASDPRPKDLDIILDVLRLGNPGERAVAAKMLGDKRYPDAASMLRTLLFDPTEGVRLAAAKALASLGESAADSDYFCQALINEHDPRAARLLGYLGGSGAVHALLEVLHVAEEETAIAAALALGELGERFALYPLIELARAEHTLVAVVAIEAIATLGDQTAIPLLVPLFEKEDRRFAVVRVLGVLGGVGVLPILQDLLAMLRNKEDDWRFLQEVLIALGHLGDPEAVPSLIGVLRGEDPRVKGSAAEALGRIGAKAATPYLLDALRSESAELRLKAARALGALCDPASLPGLVSALESDSIAHRVAAAYPLGVMSWVDLP